MVLGAWVFAEGCVIGEELQDEGLLEAEAQHVECLEEEVRNIKHINLPHSAFCFALVCEKAYGSFLGRGGMRGRGGFAGRGRGRGRGRGAGRPIVTREQLDNQLDAYMSKTKGHLDAELDAYMAQADPESME